MIRKDSPNPYGLAILDYFEGNISATLTAIDELGGTREVPVARFFWEFEEFPELEKRALELCFGKVLDIGAGAGRHSLALQQRGLTVCAIDIVPDCVTVMNKRGVHEAYCADILELEGGPFDTLLGVMNGLTMVKNLASLPRFLQHIRQLVAPNGQYLVDSTDLRRYLGSEINPLLETRVRAGRYFGELTVQVEYENNRGTISELYVDPETLCDHALQAGWNFDIILQQNNGRYLARLTPQQS